MSEPVDNKVSILILQHPQEQDRVLGTARLIAATLADAKVVIGLSWRNLAHAVKEDQLRRARGLGTVEQGVVESGQYPGEGGRQRGQRGFARQRQQVRVMAGALWKMRLGHHAQWLRTFAGAAPVRIVWKKADSPPVSAHAW